ncbi:ER membrane protein complex subunit 6-like isoform X1 [Salvia splendens]|uniref:ER membrane protein complex subunit 6-like isoform X1 n=1 Tax=Salvia splendens TaxID=180675 RepID=UPI001C265C35|nr:ER membrane protein complex subunit 6-like isoform X1 [Salvia splendens]XP_042052529.1 ER membrane protein complex subunit 6-like isoform X1 [Salvia splendens]XP_042052530.1 ER membrane protein complex subunit 6-like isoform X1 [Salvia splendens]XP_042052531.1 ER membrane protein complex subunit 6-like isoform X1 [Salvia splendens]XP_042052532.1 ER membrane protein complex subunit 6-like isoform X1 [Salvia splendens]XP_042052533.1 ER membrane protein complex subunit 6-like isoform X1 [Salvi
MAVHDDSNGQKKKSSDSLDEIPTFNVENMQNNTRIINYSRTFMSIIGGVIAGILGYTALTGFIFYFVIMAITTVGLAAKTGFAVHSFFDSWNQIVFDGILVVRAILDICLRYGSYILRTLLRGGFMEATLHSIPICDTLVLI